MNCYDCLLDGATTTAAAVCTRCGAGLCADHLRVTPETVHEPAGTGTSTHTPSARRITCLRCHEAEV